MLPTHETILDLYINMFNLADLSSQRLRTSGGQIPL